MRLTYKLEKPIDTKYLHYDYMIIADYDISRGNYGRITDSEIYNKLGQLEDVEEKLEMPIDKFFQALFGSAKMLKVWCIHPHKGLQEVFLSGFENHETARYFNAFNIDVGSITLGLSQYGKTWALTKEELENEISNIQKHNHE